MRILPHDFFFISGIYFENLVLLSSSIFFSSDYTAFSYAYFFKEDCIFRAVLSSQWYWEDGTKISRIPLPSPDHAQPPPLSRLLTRWCICHTSPTLAHHRHTESITSVRVHFWRCTIYEFRQIYPSLWYYTEYVHCPKSPLCSVHSCQPQLFFKILII